MYGSAMGSLNVDIYDGTWNNSVWSISGQQHTSSADTYTLATVDLSTYTGTIKLRFRGVAAGGYTGDMAIDDIMVIGTPTGAPDTAPPEPNVMTWSVLPYATDQVITFGSGALVSGAPVGVPVTIISSIAISLV